MAAYSFYDVLGGKFAGTVNRIIRQTSNNLSAINDILTRFPGLTRSQAGKVFSRHYAGGTAGRSLTPRRRSAHVGKHPYAVAADGV